jgi:hypothetical protein
MVERNNVYQEMEEEMKLPDKCIYEAQKGDFERFL